MIHATTARLPPQRGQRGGSTSNTFRNSFAQPTACATSAAVGGRSGGPGTVDAVALPEPAVVAAGGAAFGRGPSAPSPAGALSTSSPNGAARLVERTNINTGFRREPGHHYVEGGTPSFRIPDLHAGDVLLIFVGNAAGPNDPRALRVRAGTTDLVLPP